MNASTDWTPEELAQLPSTTTVFNQSTLIMEHHEWIQEGYTLTDNCQPKGMDCHSGGLPIPNGKLLIKDEKGYRLVDEMTRQ